MTKINREQFFMLSAIMNSMRADCMRGKVGSVLIKGNRIVASAYNGALPGKESCYDKICDINQSCTKTIHSEANLISFCAKEGITTEDCSLYITLSPCPTCSKLIIQSGIKEVVYLKEYRDNSGVILLKENGIKINQYDESIYGNISFQIS